MYKQSGLMQFDIQPILDDIDNVIKKGLAKLLDEKLNRYELLEKTHKAIMNLPSVVNEVSSLPVPKTHNMTDTILLNELSELNESFQSMCDRLTSKIDKIDDKFKEYDDKFNLLSNELLTLKNNMHLPSVVNEVNTHNVDDTILTESFQKLCDLISSKINDEFDLLTNELLTLKNNIVELKNVTPPSAQAHSNMEVETHLYQCNIKIEEAKEPENIILEMKEDNKTITFHIDECEKEKEVVKVLKRNLIIESDDEVDMTDESSFWSEYKSTTTSNTNTYTENNAEMKLDELDEILEIEIEKEKIEQRAQIQEEEEARAHEEEEGANDEGKKEDLNEVEIEEEVETEKSESEEEEEEEEDIFEIDIDDVTYCTNNETTGFIYELTDGEMGDKVGYFKDGEPFFYADEK
jgi:hypothetical protein